MQPIRRLEQAVLNKTVSSGRLFERVARVKAARVEFSTAVTIKGVAVLVTFGSKSGFVYGWSGANPDSEQTVPACAKHIRHGSVSLEQIQDGCPVRRT